MGGCKTGEAKVTGGYELPARYVIHTVGPVWRGGKRNEPGLLRNCYRNSLELARERGLRSIAFPCISTGVYGYPPQEAAETAVKAAREFLDSAKYRIDITFCCFSKSDLDIYVSLL